MIKRRAAFDEWRKVWRTRTTSINTFLFCSLVRGSSFTLWRRWHLEAISAHCTLSVHWHYLMRGFTGVWELATAGFQQTSPVFLHFSSFPAIFLLNSFPCCYYIPPQWNKSLRFQFRFNELKLELPAPLFVWYTMMYFTLMLMWLWSRWNLFGKETVSEGLNVSRCKVWEIKRQNWVVF